MNLNIIDNMIQRLRKTSSTKEKKQILIEHLDPLHSGYSSIVKFLNFTYNCGPYRVTSKSIKNHTIVDMHTPTLMSISLEDLLDHMFMGFLSGHNALDHCQVMKARMGQYSYILDLIVDRDIKCGVNKSILKQVGFNYLGKTSDYFIALAQEMKTLPDWNNGWYVSRKIDGVRCIAKPFVYTVDMISRNGKYFSTLGKVKEDILKLNLSKCIIDGEICLGDSDNFQDVMKQIRRKNHTIENIKFKVFDMISFNSYPSLSLDKYSVRYNEILKTFKNCDYIEVIHQEKIRDDAHFNEWIDRSEKEGWEGLILRADVKFEAGRSKNMLKVKRFHDDEYVVGSIETGPFSVNSNGIKQELMMTSVTIKHKGYIVNVGSGFTLEQRRRYYSNPEEIIGKVITVKYFEETKDQNGNISLRFPTVKIVHGDAREF